MNKVVWPYYQALLLYCRRASSSTLDSIFFCLWLATLISQMSHLVACLPLKVIHQQLWLRNLSMLGGYQLLRDLSMLGGYQLLRDLSMLGGYQLLRNLSMLGGYQLLRNLSMLGGYQLLSDLSVLGGYQLLNILADTSIEFLFKYFNPAYYCSYLIF